MREHPSRWKGRLLAMLLVPAVLIAAAAPAAPSIPQSAAARAAEFDRVFQRIVGPTSMDANSADYEADLERLRVLLPPGDAARDVRFRSVYCGSEHWEDFQQGLAYSDQALQRAHAAHDLASEARAQFCRTSYLDLLEGSRRSLAEANTLVAMLEKSTERQLLAEALMARGSTLSILGEQAKAMMDFQRARAGFRASGIEHEVDALLFEIAVAYRRMGDWPQAERYFTQSVLRMQKKQDWDMVVTDLIQLGFLHDESGAPKKAAEFFTRAINIATEHQNVTSASGARLGLASAQIALGQPDAALATLARARSGLAAEHINTNDDMLLLLTGRALAGKGQHAQALARYQLALPLIKRDGNQRYLAMLYQAQAASKEALGRNADALADYKRYAELQLTLQSKMRLQQSRLLEYEYEIRRRDFENRRLRAEASTRQQQLNALERERHWQILALTLGALLVMVLLWLSLRQWRRSRQLRLLAMSDPLTGVLSRRAIETTMERSLAQDSPRRLPISILVLDLDHFKRINDQHGHAAGDTVLHATAQIWQSQLRDNDHLGRIGGEEFVVVCEDTRLAHALNIAERLLQATRALQLSEIDQTLHLSTSIGVAEAAPDDTRETLFARADAALYRAKQHGRDRVET